MRRLRTLIPSRRRPSVDWFEKAYNINQLQRFEAVLNRNGYSLRQFSSILDFGCGHGRLTQYLFDIAPQARVFGCDVRNDLVAECRRKYPNGGFITNDPTPPLSFDDAQFDLIYSYSVFTHLSESNHAAWLEELAGKLNPGGVMLHTTKSYESLRRMAMFSAESVEKYKLPELVDAFIQSTHRYYYILDDSSTPEYGQTIISRDYITTTWPDYTGMNLVEYVEGAIEAYSEGCQDIVLLVKNPK